MPDITIQISGDDSVRKGFNTIQKEIKDASEPLLEASNAYNEAISENFKTRGRTFGQPWKPIKQATINIKKKLKTDGKAIAYTVPLVRTGEMRDAFGYTLVGKNTSRIINYTQYAQFHQEGLNGVPRRILADIDTKRINMVSNVFAKWIDRIVTNFEKK